MTHPVRVVLFANTDWYLFNFRLSLAHSLEKAGYEVYLMSPPGDYGARLREAGLRWIAAPMQRRSLNPLRELHLLIWLLRFFHREQIDIVHGFTIKCAIYGSIAARLRPGMRRINAVAGLGYVFVSQDGLARTLRPLVRLLMRLAFAGKGARLILQNPDDQALFLRYRLVEEERVHLIPGSGVDCAHFCPPVSESSQVCGSESLRIVLASRMLFDKGVVEFVDAARELRAAGYSVECLLAGTPDEGNPASVPEDLLDQWQSAGLVRWLGYVEDMAALYQGADVVVLPSYREGLPKSLIEAAACGRALVTTDVPGCRSVVSDGVDGLLVPARSSHALASAIKKLCDDSDLRHRLGMAAREKALGCFSQEKINGFTLEVYEQVQKD